jgi:hypothetical protein
MDDLEDSADPETGADRETKAFDLPPTEPAPAPVTYERAERRAFGLAPHALVAALAALALGAALSLLVTGHLVAGLLLLGLALLLGALYVEQARGRRASAFDRVTAAAVDNSRALAGFAGASVRAWTSAGRRVAQLRLETSRLARERSQLQYELGSASYDEDAGRTEELRVRMRALDERLEACADEARAVLDDARSRTSEERLAVGPTEIREPDEAPGSVARS